MIIPNYWPIHIKYIYINLIRLLQERQRKALSMELRIAHRTSSWCWKTAWRSVNGTSLRYSSWYRTCLQSSRPRMWRRWSRSSKASWTERPSGQPRSASPVMTHFNQHKVVICHIGYLKINPVSLLSVMRPGPAGKGQDWLQWPLCYGASRQDQKTNQDYLRQPQPCMGWELQFVSGLFFEFWLMYIKYILSRISAHGDTKTSQQWVSQFFRSDQSARVGRGWRY